MTAAASVGAVVLGGGRSTRFGSDKLVAEVDGLPLLRHAVDAVLPLAGQVIVVGSPAAALPDGVVVVADSQQHAGPYAAVRDGIDALSLDVDVVLVLAGDLVAPAPMLPLLLAALEADAAGPGSDRRPEAAVAVDADGRRQPLLAAYRVEPLVAGMAGVDAYHRAAYALLDGLHVVEVPDPTPGATATHDIDTPDDLSG
jgi:molybdopterin-guanine dinucleotide biosynthesis protein A